MARSLEAHDRKLREVLGGDMYRFAIPDYQRPYAWTTEEAGALIEDLFGAMEATAKDEETPYFLGSVVLIKKEGDPRADVVDGQQRLTTLTLLVAVLRERLRATDPKLADGLAEFLCKKDLWNEASDVYRLTVRREDAAFFRKYVQSDGGIEALLANRDALRDSRLRYRENVVLFHENLARQPEEFLRRLARFLAVQCSLVVISTPSEESAFRIFSVLNDRGLDLAPVDIVKAQVLGEITDPVSRAEYADAWSAMEDELGRDAFGELLSHLRSIYAKQKAMSSLTKEFTGLRKKYEELSNPVKLIDQVLKPLALAWDDIKDADFESTEHAEAINDRLRWLNLVEFKDWVPPALVYMCKFRSNPAGLLSFFVSLERLTYGLLLMRVGVNERIRRYSALTDEVERSLAGLVTEVSSLDLSDNEKQKILAALDGPVYEDLPKARMAVVLRLESLANDGSVIRDYKHVSIEHVLPQTPRPLSDWMGWFAQQDVREYWTHRLANLVPLDGRKNTSASNKNFADKKESYFKRKGERSPFVLTNNVIDALEWTPALLEKMQQSHLERLKKHWLL